MRLSLVRKKSNAPYFAIVMRHRFSGVDTYQECPPWLHPAFWSNSSLKLRPVGFSVLLRRSHSIPFIITLHIFRTAILSSAPQIAATGVLPHAAYRTSCASPLPASCLTRHTALPVHRRYRRPASRGIPHFLCISTSLCKRCSRTSNKKRRPKPP
jgi:hypothetical protein